MTSDNSRLTLRFATRDKDGANVEKGGEYTGWENNSASEISIDVALFKQRIMKIQQETHFQQCN